MRLLLLLVLTLAPACAFAGTTLDAADSAEASGEAERRGAEMPLQLARIVPAAPAALPSRPASAFLPGVSPVADIEGDGSSNPCGPYSAVVTARSFADRGQTFNDGYRRMAPSHFGLGTGPQAIERYLREEGRSTSSYNRFSSDQLAARIDRGERGIVLVNLSNDDPNAGYGQRFRQLHWMPVKGYNMVPDAGGNLVRHFVFEDNALAGGGAFTPGGRYPNGIPQDEFERMWSRPVPYGLRTAAGNLDRFYIGVNEEPPSFWSRARHAGYLYGDQTRLRVGMDAARDATVGWDRTFGPWSQYSLGDRIGGASQLVGGAGVKGVVNLVPGTVSTAGSFVEQGGDAMLDWGRSRYHRGGFFNRTAGIGATILGSVPKTGGWVVNQAGNLGSSAVGVAGDVIQGTGNFVGRRVDDASRAARGAWNWAASWF